GELRRRGPSDCAAPAAGGALTPAPPSHRSRPQARLPRPRRAPFSVAWAGAPRRCPGARHFKKSLGVLRERPEVKFRFMEQSREFAVGQLCRVLGVSRSGFYAWRRRPRSERERQTTILVGRIRAVHRAARGIYRSARVDRAVRSAGYAIGE